MIEMYLLLELTEIWSRKMLWTKQPLQAAAFLETL